MRRVDTTSEFAHDLDILRKRGSRRDKLDAIVEHARVHGRMPGGSMPHKLNGVWTGYWECHIGFDWLLIYTIDTDQIVLWRTGTHDDLFG